MSRWWSFSLKIVLTGGVLGGLGLAVEPSSLLGAFRDAQWSWVAVALLLLPINLLLDGWVWTRLLEPVTGPLSPRTLTGAVLSGMALGVWTPIQLGEYAGRTFYLQRGDRWSVSLTIFAQRMADMAVAVDAGLVALFWALSTGTLPFSPPWLVAAALGLVVGGLLTSFVVMPGAADRLARRFLGKTSSITRRTATFHALSSRQIVQVAAGSLLRYLVFTTQFICLALAFLPSAPFFLLVVATGLIFYVKYLLPSITMLDLGLREGAAVGFFHLLGLSTASALNAALLLFAMNRLIPAALGIPFLFRLQFPGTDPAPSISQEAPSILSG